LSSISCLRTCRTRWTTVIHAVAARSTIAHGSSPHGASTRPAVMTTTRSAREPIPTSPRSPSPSAVAREHERDRGQHETLADAVGGRVEEGAERRRLAAGARERPIEDVEQRADDDDDGAEPEEEDLVPALEQHEDRGGRDRK